MTEKIIGDQEESDTGKMLPKQCREMEIKSIKENLRYMKHDKIKFITNFSNKPSHNFTRK